MAPPKRCFEFIVQITAMVVSAGAFVAALLTEIKSKDLSQGRRTLIEGASNNLLGQNELFLKTEATAGLVFATTGVAGVIGFVALAGRILNVRHEQTNRRIFVCLYLLFVLVCFLGFAVAGVLGVFTSIDWSELLSSRQTSSIIAGATTEVENIRNSIAATSGCSLLAAVLYGALELLVVFCYSAAKEY